MFLFFIYVNIFCDSVNLDVFALRNKCILKWAIYGFWFSRDIFLEAKVSNFVSDPTISEFNL